MGVRGRDLCGSEWRQVADSRGHDNKSAGYTNRGEMSCLTEEQLVF